MCDCPCKCWQNKPVRQRITNTFIHTDIFSQGNGLNVKCEAQPGQAHACKCNNLFQKPVIKDTRYRPRDHPDQYFFSQELAQSGCCRQARCCNDGGRVEEQRNVGNAAQSLYYFQELPPAGQYKSSAQVPKTCYNSRFPSFRGIHTSNAVDYDGHECHKDAWFNDDKERQIGRLNSAIGRGYSCNRKRLDMVSNAFDFVDDNVEYACPHAQATTAKFRNAEYDNYPVNVCQKYSNNKIELQKPKAQQPKSKGTVTFKGQEDSTKKAISTTNKKTKNEPVKKQASKIESNKKQTKEKKEDIKQEIVKETSVGKCTCTCQCWKKIQKNN